MHPTSDELGAPAPLQALRALWVSAGGKPAALGDVTLTGADPALPSSFRVGTLAQATIGAAALAAAEVWRHRTGRVQAVAVDMRRAAIELRSERYMRLDGRAPGPAWDRSPASTLRATGARCGCIPTSRTTARAC